MPLASVERLDTTRATRGWREVAPLSEPRSHAMLVAAGGRVFALGGFSARLGAQDSCEVYDPAADAWAPASSPPGLKLWFGAAALAPKQEELTLAQAREQQERGSMG